MKNSMRNIVNFTLILMACLLSFSACVDVKKQKIPAKNQLTDTSNVPEKPKSKNLSKASDTKTNPSEPVVKKEPEKTEPKAASPEQAVKKAKQRPQKKPSIEFEQIVFRFDTIQQGEKVNHQFKFKNSGNAALQITNATATCGCTQPSFPFVPIAPGESGYIGVVFDSKGKKGRQRPAVTITANTTAKKHELYLEGFVQVK